MNTMPQTNSTNYSPTQEDDDYHEHRKSSDNGTLSISKGSSRRQPSNNYLMNKVSPLISRSVRAKRRQAFLRTYQLSHLNNSSVVGTTEDSSKCGDKMKQAAMKIRSVFMSLNSAARLSLERRCCSFRPMICCASLPSTQSIRLG